MSRYIDIHTHNPAAPSPDLLQIEALMIGSTPPELPRGLFSTAIHPYSLSDFDITWIDRLQSAAANPTCVAIGETGLDLRSEYRATEKQQHAVFDEHIFLAQKLDKPLIVHSVKALNPVLRHLEKTTTPVIFHGFASNAETARQIIAKGHYISLGQKITHDTALQEQMREVDLTHILLETDDRDYPIQEIYLAMSLVKQITIEELKAQIEQTFHAIFPPTL